MKCEDVQDVLDLKAVGETPAGLPDVGSHLTSCPDCHEYAADIESVSSVLAAVPMEKPSDASSRTLRIRIAQLEAEKVSQADTGFSLAGFFGGLSQMFGGQRLAYGAMAMATMAVGASVLVMNPSVPADGVAQNPAGPGAAPMMLAAAPADRTNSVEILSGQVMSSGLLINPDRLTGKPTRISVPKGQNLSTLKGHRATLQLADGTHVLLAGGSQVSVGDHELRLACGQAAIHVIKGGQGFRAVMPRATTEVMGTRFVVGAERVELIEGAVKVTAGHGSTKLAPGQQAAVAVDSGAVETTAIDTARVSQLYRVFAGLDGKEGLARDLGMSTAELEARMALPAPPVAIAEPVSVTPVPSAIPEPVALVPTSNVTHATSIDLFQRD